MHEVIHLNEAEQKLCKDLASDRNQYNRKRGIKNKKKGPQSAEITDLNGMGAEIAFCKLFNVYPDLHMGVFAKEDCHLHNGLGVDVKTTTYPNGRLLVALDKIDKQADFYALMVGTFPTYRYAGMISAKEVFNDENINDLGHGKCYLIDQRRLHG